MGEHCLVAASDQPAAYATRTLAPDAAEAFEDHLIGCATCQASVREALALAVVLETPAKQWGARSGVGAAAVLLVALGAALSWPADPLRRLGAVGPAPAFQGLAVRADPDSLTALEDRGLAAYLAGDFAEAAALLGRAARDESGPAVHFILGVSLLKDGRAEAAAAALARATDPPRNPYAAEARFYLAKAHLTLGDAASALEALSGIDGADPQWPRAAALADSVRRVLR